MCVCVCVCVCVCGTFVVLSEAVTPQQVDAVGRSHVQVDVLQVEQEGEQQRPLQVSRLFNTTNNTKTGQLKTFITQSSFLRDRSTYTSSQITPVKSGTVFWSLGRTCRCFATDSSRKPNKKPLYWKWISEELWRKFHDVLHDDVGQQRVNYHVFLSAGICRTVALQGLDQSGLGHLDETARCWTTRNTWWPQVTSLMMHHSTSPVSIVHFLELSHWSNQSADFKFRIVYIHVYFLPSTFCSSASWSKHLNWQNSNSENFKLFLLLDLGLIFSQLKDTIDDEEAEVPEQQNSQNEGRTVQNVPRAFLLLNAPAAPGGQRTEPIRLFSFNVDFS